MRPEADVKPAQEVVLPALLESDLEVVCEFLFGGGALLLDIQQLPVVVQHDHELVGVTQTQVGQNGCVLQVLSSLLIGQKSLRGEQQDALTAPAAQTVSGGCSPPST